jgi:DNA-binding response OmpR family regulator
VIALAELLTEAWGDPILHSSHSVNVHGFNSQQKLENDPANPVRLMTAHGVGYKVVPCR